MWRRRHYRVRPAKRADSLPGQFFFNVLDNGVASNEYWRILDCADDLSWAIFYYSGAASAAGTSYSGALLVTPDGQWPEELRCDGLSPEDCTKIKNKAVYQRIEAAFAKAEITLWELFQVDNTISLANLYEESNHNLVFASPPPLGIK